ncbi:uncharacterized protein LOC122263876 [Penaeus japonicus]|uniref:uncharacterized protein LOC122263876 n=1 Tax=Penaeus japonicus TaxID=27405 RepID=UPI001C70D633|nr:uncharacterized protein LOC122263876 [Penaeus japonicus]XP_042888455.1 uncharacterized protein LOC122263876 [Penaeus japonicus]
MQILAVATCMILLTGSSTGLPQDTQRGARVSSAFQKLRSPITEVPLAEMFKLMNNRNNIKFYVDCVTEKGSCNNIGKAMQSLILDVQAGGEICRGCSDCELDRVQYMLDTLRTEYTDLACQIQNYLRRPIFAGRNPCI